jgi:hypothetical protein
MITEDILQVLKDKGKMENFLRSNIQAITCSKEFLKLIEEFLEEKDERKKDLIMMQMAESHLNNNP